MVDERGGMSQTEPQPRESIWSVHPRYRLFYVILFLATYLGAGSVGVDWNHAMSGDEGLASFFYLLDYDAVATVGIVAATFSFVVVEITGGLMVLYEAGMALLNRRRAKREREAMQKGADKVIHDLQEQGIIVHEEGGKYVTCDKPDSTRHAASKK